ncbi:MAG: hypothetical protein A2Y12_07930 [Planctomycetes bacterium GWF2_42_9]|nr:MAG: hypothetical protein A2Y12_07930 [Planctomycetes bacterium GWF2_42_9]
MDQQQCQSCGMKDHCQEVYKKLGECKSPSVLTKVISAFLLPLILFIISIVLGQKFLLETLKSERKADLAAFAAAIVVVFMYLLALKVINIWRRQN